MKTGIIRMCLLLQHQSLYYNLSFTCACFLCRHAHTSVKTPTQDRRSWAAGGHKAASRHRS